MCFRIVFMGSATLSCTALDAVIADAGNRVVGVVTQPDRPRGRGRHTASCPLNAHVRVRYPDVPLLTPQRASSVDAVDAVRALAPDVIAVVAYGQILRANLLAVPPKGCINLHASLLPAYRGAAPIQHAILQGETRTGVTSMFMDVGMDTGDMIYQEQVPIADDDTGGSLCGKLADVGARLLARTLVAVREGVAPRIPQDHAAATLAPKLTRKDARIDWTASAARTYTHVRALDPKPGCFCMLGDDRRGLLRVFRVGVELGTGAPGTVLDVTGDGPLVATGSGAVRLLDVQPDGKRRMQGRAYLCGRHMTVGMVLPAADGA